MIKNPWKEARELKAMLAIRDAELARERRVSFTLIVSMHEIVACDTQRANATVKRCVMIAKAGLGAVK